MKKLVKNEKILGLVTNSIYLGIEISTLNMNFRNMNEMHES